MLGQISLCPKDPAVLKTVRDSELLCRSVFTTPPDLLRREPLFDGRKVCNSQENSVGTRRAAIANHYAIVNLLRRAYLLRRSIFSTAGSFGWNLLRPLFFFSLGCEGPSAFPRIGFESLISRLSWGHAKGAAKAFCGETVVQKGVFGESVSSLPPQGFMCFTSKP